MILALPLVHRVRSRSGSRAARSVLALALAMCAVACRSRGASPPPPPRPPDTASPAARRASPPAADAGGASSTAVALAEIDARIASLRRIVARRNDDWLDLEFIAQAYINRARLSADWDDYQHADETLQEAFRIAPPGAGPVLTRANFNYTMHRFQQVEPDLRAVEHWVLVNEGQRNAVASLRADVAFHSGRYDEARRGYDALLAVTRSVSMLVALAQLDWKTGDFDAADRLLDEAERMAATGEAGTRAFVSLVRGLMNLDRGRWDVALAHYRQGLTFRPGYYLLEEHVAEVLALQGHADEATTMYRDLVARTHDPEFMDALAELLAARGERAEADRLLAEARANYDRRLRIFPEAIAGHALAHFLRHDPARAVQIAEINRAARPGGEAQVLLAQAYLRVHRDADARTVIDSVLSTAWNTAELHATAAIVFDRQGPGARAEQERRRATAINPHANEALDWLRAGTNGG